LDGAQTDVSIQRRASTALKTANVQQRSECILTRCNGSVQL